MPASHSSIRKNYERIEALPNSAETRKLKNLARSAQDKFGEDDLSLGWSYFLRKASERDLLTVMPGTIGRTARLDGVKRRARTAKVNLKLSASQQSVFRALGDALAEPPPAGTTGPPPFILIGDTLRVFALGGTRIYLERVAGGLDEAVAAKSLTKVDANKIRLAVTAVLRKVPYPPEKPRGRGYTPPETNGSLGRSAREELVGV